MQVVFVFSSKTLNACSIQLHHQTRNGAVICCSIFLKTLNVQIQHLHITSLGAVEFWKTFLQPLCPYVVSTTRFGYMRQCIQHLHKTWPGAVECWITIHKTLCGIYYQNWTVSNIFKKPEKAPWNFGKPFFKPFVVSTTRIGQSFTHPTSSQNLIRRRGMLAKPFFNPYVVSTTRIRYMGYG